MGSLIIVTIGKAGQIDSLTVPGCELIPNKKAAYDSQIPFSLKSSHGSNNPNIAVCWAALVIEIDGEETLSPKSQLKSVFA